MSRIIGVLSCAISDNRQFVTQNYIDAIVRIPATPLIIPATSRTVLDDYHSIHEYVEVCDGFLFCGGGDISSLLYGEEPVDNSSETDFEFDRFQIELMKLVIDRKKPVLAICRGMQVMNVALGGTLIQDIGSTVKDCIEHQQHTRLRSDVSHTVYFRERTILREIYGESKCTNSHHHQAIGKLGKGVVVSATTIDGIVEGIEVENHPFAVGVQFHCELGKRGIYESL